MDAEHTGCSTYEARMLDYARRTALAAESLRAFAWIWSIFAVLGAVILVTVYG